MPNISRNKSNQTIKFGQLIDSNTSNIFPEKSCTKYGGEAGVDSFVKELQELKSKRVKVENISG